MNWTSALSEEKWNWPISCLNDSETQESLKIQKNSRRSIPPGPSALACEQALLSPAPRGFAVRSRVLARLASLAR